MRAPLYLLEEGPEWQDSVEAADPHDERFGDNLEALKLALQYGPWKYSHGLTKQDDPVRVATTKDRAAGYRLVAGRPHCAAESDLGMGRAGTAGRGVIGHDWALAVACPTNAAQAEGRLGAKSAP